LLLKGNPKSPHHLELHAALACGMTGVQLELKGC
jgi:hypothetical protein